MANKEENIGRTTVKIAKDIKANCIVCIEKNKNKNYNAILFKEIRPNLYSKTKYATKIRKDSTLSIREVLTKGINKQCIQKGDRIVCFNEQDTPILNIYNCDI